ncbi:cytochrome P450 [Fadolivirus algeromassiliense]|jgi:cytochrome P450|uniref:Cytochrome P450 n=1 Tax=Fadolivirus FV1/VV64 TaxID=3070911 RepID=A0A7D3QWM6_9VIRU|nr:cytochrome P450 [Fadolivirus algeromassiliense]QKF94739.1 cytochrome P450 [Fadolivirus FV1/VV64]
MYAIYIGLGIVLITVIIRYLYTWYLYARITRNQVPNGAKIVPLVDGALPLIGHSSQFSRDPIGFVRNAQKRYGNYFKIRLLNKDIVVICDREACNEYFKSSEKRLSLYEVLDGLYFSKGFSDNKSFFPTIITIIKRSVEVKYEKFADKIMDEAQRMITKLQASNREVDLKAEMSRFISNTSARCFVGIELTDEFFDILTKFSHLLNKIIVITYFVPKWLLNITVNRQLKVYRSQMIRLLKPTVMEYINNPDLKESKILRNAANFVDDNGKKLTWEQVAEIIICMLYISSENTALGLTIAMIDLSQKPEFWDAVKQESEKHLNDNNIRSLFDSPILEAAIMESARMNSHLFALMRKPRSVSDVLNGYYIGDAYSVALCEPLLMRYECSTDLYQDPNTYNPNRFLEPMCESKASSDIMTWGSSTHMCPGKMFALYELKAAMAMIVTTFKRFNIDKNKITDLDFFSPAAFADRKAFVKFEKL